MTTSTTTSHRDQLLQWVRERVEPYNVDRKGDKLKNFGEDWKDGSLLFALVDSLKHGTLTSYDMSGFAHDPSQDVAKALDIAEHHFHVPKLLEVADIDEADEYAIQAYVSSICEAAPKTLDEDAIRRLQRDTAYPSMCSASGAGLENARPKENNVFKIQAVNGHGQPLKVGGCQFKVDISGPNKEENVAKIVDKANGIYEVTYQVKQEGIYEMAIRLMGQKGIDQVPAGHPGWGEHIEGSPFTVRARSESN